MQHPSFVPQPDHATAHSFFEIVCQNLLLMRKQTCHFKAGICAFDIYGKQGGRWVIDFARLKIERSDTVADLSLVFQQEDFNQLLLGNLTITDIYAKQRMMVVGNNSLLANLIILFSPVH